MIQWLLCTKGLTWFKLGFLTNHFLYWLCFALLGGIEQPKMASVIGLFRRESSGSAQDSRASSESSLHHTSGPESPPAPGAVLLIEEGGSEPLQECWG